MEEMKLYLMYYIPTAQTYLKHLKLYWKKNNFESPNIYNAHLPLYT